MNQLISTWQSLDVRRRVVLVGAVALTFVGALEQMNVEAEVRGDAIFVLEDARDRVRLSLAREGLPRQGQAGYELLDELSGFSATADMFNAAYWRAKEGELARTILASPGVRAARVHIAVPTRRPFARDAAGPTASVTLTMAGGALTKEQAMAVRYLVALAVDRLDPAQVAVIDSRAGMVLAPGKDNQFASALAQASEREAKLKADIEELLAARVGRDRARVSVAVETHREAETVTERVIKPDTRVTIHSETSEVSDTSQGSAGNVTVASNLPEGDAAASNSNERTRSETRERVNYDYSEVRRETVRQAGAIRRISVAVLVDGIVTTDASGTEVWQARPEEELADLRNLVIAAIGFDESRGDIVIVDSMAFQADATPGALVEVSPLTRFVERNAMTMIQLAVLAAVAVILSFTVIRPLINRSARAGTGGLALAGPGGSGEVSIDDEVAGLLAANDGGGGFDGDLSFDMATIETPPHEMLRSVALEKPEETADMLRQWLVDAPADEGVAA